MRNQKQYSLLLGVVHEFLQELDCAAVTMRGFLQDHLHIEVPALDVAQQLVLPVRLFDEFFGDHEGSPDEVMLLVLYMCY